MLRLGYVWGTERKDRDTATESEEQVVDECLTMAVSSVVEKTIELTKNLASRYLRIDRYCID